MAFRPVRRPRRLFIKTRDHWRLAVYRYWRGHGTSRRGPLLLMHGLGANRFNLAAPAAEINLASYLHGRGHDVWVAELRGSGASRPPGWPLARRRAYDFDDFVHKDVPALMRGVLDLTGAPALHWVGHSMGGMLAYAALLHFDHRFFRSVVTVGSPAFTAVKHPAVDQLYRLKFLLGVVRWLPNRTLGRLAALAPAAAARPVVGILGNADNMDPRHVRMLARRALNDLPAPLIKQFAEWYGELGGFSREDRLLDYYEHLHRIEAPILLVAGAGDVLSPISDLAAVFAAISSPDKKLLVCGVDQGFSLDYGHIDLILGVRAREEIYPHIARWVESH